MYIGSLMDEKKMTAKTYIALLRGINVGGQKKIIMSDLRKLLEDAGLQKVQTYIQSGNILFESGETNQAKIEQKIFKSIIDFYGFEVPVLVISPADLKELIDNNPFLSPSGEEESKLYVAFLYDLPNPALVKELKKLVNSDEKFEIMERYIFMYYAKGYGKSKMNNNFFEQKLKVQSTSRNWKTINTLYKMSYQD